MLIIFPSIILALTAPFVLYYKGKHIRFVIYLLLLLTLSVVFIYTFFRTSIGTDYFNYRDAFNETTESQLGYVYNILIPFINNIFEYETHKYIFAIHSVIYLYLIISVSTKFKEYRALIVLLLISIYFYNNMLGSLRQGLSLLLYVLLFIKIHKNQLNNLKLIISLIFLMGLHTGSIVLSPFAILYYVSKKHKLIKGTFLLLISFFIVFIVIYLSFEFYDSKLSFYEDTKGFNDGGASYLKSKLIFLPLIILIFTKFKIQESILIVSMFITTSLLPLYLQDYPIIAERVGSFFEIYKILILYFLLENSNYRIFKYTFLLFVLSTLFKNYVYLINWKNYFF